MLHRPWPRCPIVALAAGVALAACNVPPTQFEPVPADEVRQLFLIQLRSGSVAGHAFLLNRPGATPLGVTAYHVAGPIAQSTDPEGTPTAWLFSPVGQSAVLRLGARVPITGARTISSAGSQDDLAAFEVIDRDVTRSLELAEDLPGVGDTVWVLAVHGGDHPLNGPRRHPARVAVAHDSAFVYAYLASKNPDFTSGAAVLDRGGRVVGVNVGTLIVSADGWQRYRERYAPCCDGMSGGEVVGLAVGVRSVRLRLPR
jgi:hypothetical protein